MQKIKVENNMVGGGVWLIGWMFTIGFVGLTKGQAVLAIVIWPYYIGEAVNSLVF